MGAATLDEDWAQDGERWERSWRTDDPDTWPAGLAWQEGGRWCWEAWPEAWSDESEDGEAETIEAAMAAADAVLKRAA